MADGRYSVMARWWNGHGWDVTVKDCKTTDNILGAVKLLVKQVRPYQISITDTRGTGKPPDDWVEDTDSELKKDIRGAIHDWKEGTLPIDPVGLIALIDLKVKGSDDEIVAMEIVDETSFGRRKVK